MHSQDKNQIHNNEKKKPAQAKNRRVMASFIQKHGIEAYRVMLLIRRFEERVGQLYGMGKIGGFCHLYIGQEAVVTGVHYARRPEDQVITGYRDHGHLLVCGVDPKSVLAELTGRRHGCSKGKGGSMHMFSKEHEFYGGHGIVGAQVPIGTGLAFANRYRSEDRVAVVYMGDGAVNQGQVYESFNMAALWKLPVVYIIENNAYAMGTSVVRSSANVELSRRGEGFKVPGRKVDGMDVCAVYAETVDAIAHARSGKGPIVLEMLTYRYRGHSMSDPGTYRDRQEIDTMRKEKDPIAAFQAVLEREGVLDATAIQHSEAQVKARVQEAMEFAQSDPEPDPESLWKDVVIE